MTKLATRALTHFWDTLRGMYNVNLKLCSLCASSCINNNDDDNGDGSNNHFGVQIYTLIDDDPFRQHFLYLLSKSVIFFIFTLINAIEKMLWQH